MKQTKPLSIALALLAALEVPKTAHAIRPEQSEGLDLSLEHQPLKLKLATGNLGGGKPQPEFQGGHWETNFGPFEKLLGAMALATAKGCPSEGQGWAPATYYARYTDSKDYEGCEGGAIKFQGRSFKLPTFAEEVIPQKKLGEVVEALGGSVPEKAAKTLYGKDATLQKLFEAELASGKGFSGAEGCLKERLAYPYFEEGFMQLVAWRRDSPGEFLERYLKDLRGKEDDLKFLKGLGAVPAAVLPDKRENAPVTFCKVKGPGMREQIFSKDGFVKGGKVITDKKTKKVILLDWLLMALWDIYIVDAYVQWSQVPGNKFDALVSMTQDEEDAAILRVADYFVKDADIFFVQEVGGKLCAQGRFDGALAHCIVQVDTYDAALFVNKKLASAFSQDTDTVRASYGKLLADVVSGKDAAALETITSENNRKKLTGKGSVEEVSALGKVELAVAELGPDKVRVLLVSAHPDSNGVNCALQLYLAKKVYEENQGLGLQYLIVGSDTNLQTEEDYKEKLKKGESGYLPAMFKAKVAELGFDVLWPEHPTVHKQRTFLQTQLNKAGKHDNVVKDMVFVYPKNSISTPVPEAAVWNVLDKNKKPHFHLKDRYPTKDWPMDHCVTTAEVTLQPKK